MEGIGYPICNWRGVLVTGHPRTQLKVREVASMGPLSFLLKKKYTIHD